jgi:putative ABC transport system permease protein
MNSVLRLAFKLLFNDRAKSAALLIGTTFAVFLMVQMMSLFAGILNKSSSTVTNIGAQIWVMDPGVQTIASSIGMPDYMLNAVRSIDGVRYAVPLYSGGAQIRLSNGSYQAVTVIGLDDATLYGWPKMKRGRIADIYAENGFIAIDDAEFPKLLNPRVGTEFELNDHRAVVVGIATVPSSGLFGVPTLYTTYNRAIQYIPNTRYTTSYILVEPKSLQAIPHIQAAVRALGYAAYTKNQFMQRVSDFYKYQTGVGMNLLLMTGISFIVGLSISGQTFYTFIVENLDKFGALKAIGATNRQLFAMIVFQAVFTSLTGYGLGIGLCVLTITFARWRIPSYAAMITFPNLAFALGMVMVIASASGYLGVRKVLRIEPFDVFRS